MYLGLKSCEHKIFGDGFFQGQDTTFWIRKDYLKIIRIWFTESKIKSGIFVGRKENMWKKLEENKN